MTSDRTVFPFCLEIRIRMVRNRKRQPVSRLPIISSAWISSHFCHGYSFLRSTSVAYSMHAKPRVVSGVSSLSGGVKILGSVQPRILMEASPPFC